MEAGWDGWGDSKEMACLGADCTSPVLGLSYKAHHGLRKSTLAEVLPKSS